MKTTPPRRPSEPQTVHVSVRRVGGRVDVRTIRRRTRRLLTLLERPRAELSVVLCDDAFISDLNQKYRRKRGPTDVLSFSMTEGEYGEVAGETLGDIVISLDTAQRQANELGHGILDEVTSLLIHGLLHLLGYDHMKPADARTMFALSRKLEEQLKMRGKNHRKFFGAHPRP